MQIRTLSAGLLVLASAVLATADAPATQPATQPNAQAPEKSAAPSVLGFTMKRIDGVEQPLDEYAGRVLLIVNTASKCGFTKQYEGLEALNKKYAADGLAVLGFPSDDFKNQEFGSDAEIAEFCKATYGVSFDMFSKIDVTGEAKSPLYRALTTADGVEPGEVKWNFEKFLIGRDGKVVARYRSKVTPNDPALVKAIEAELAKPAPH